MTVRSKEPGAQGRPDASSPVVLGGGWLRLVRAVWLAVAVLVVGMFLAAVPLRYEQFFSLSYLPEGMDPTALRANLERAGLSMGFYAAYHLAMEAGFALLCLALGVVIWRRSDERMALFVSLLLVFLGTTFWGVLQALAAVYPAWGPAVMLVDSLGTVSLFVFFYLFPDGRFVPRWTRWVTVAALVLITLSVFFPGSLLNPDNYPIPVFLLFMLGLLLSGVVAQGYRYRRVSGPIQRQQTKWVIFGFAAAIAGFLGVIFFGEVLLSVVRPGTLFELLGSTAITLFMLLIPLSIGVAILRYSLFDIDVVINRALVYASLTAALVMIYVGGVVLLQSVFRALTGQGSQFAVVASTLAIAALFRPLRRRVQEFIDRRFYRRKYDAVRTLEAFGTRLRAEVDLETLGDDLVAVVGQTMQPSHVSLWLRQPSPLGRAPAKEGE